jgi:aspartate aminotransferase
MKELVKNSSGIRAMFEEGKRLARLRGAENVYDFSLGNPSAPPHEDVKAAVTRILNEESPTLVHGYMNNSGFEDTREKIAQSVNAEFGQDYGADNIVMTCGAAGALNVTLKAIINPGDEVIVFSPFFVEYAYYVSNFNGVTVESKTDESTFLPDPEDLESKITSRTKAVILNSPNNPTGAVYDEKILKRIAGVLDAKQKEFGRPIFALSDEPYRKIAYDGVKPPFIPSIYRNCFVAYSYSKALSLPGERIGYIIAPSDMDSFDEITCALNVANRVLGYVNAPSLFQRVAALCRDTAIDISVYEKNLSFLYSALTDIGYECVKPKGAFYLFPKAPGGDDLKFCALAKEFMLLLVPGTAFHTPGYFRLAYCVSYETCVNSIDAFRKAFDRAVS